MGSVATGAERRKESRLKTKQLVTMTLLSVSIGSRSPVFEACVVDVSGSGLRVRTPGPMPGGAPVRIDAKELTMLGEVCRCEADNGAYLVGIKLSHAFTMSDDLQQLNEALMSIKPGNDWSADREQPARDAVRTRS
jgi:hypothetical protein